MQEGPSPRKVLVVEDTDDIALSLKEALERHGYSVVIAHDAPLALRLARDFGPDIALIDIGLPVMNGWELAKRLRGQRPDVRIIAVTAYSDDDSRARSADLGFAAHLIKPVTVDQLASAIEQAATA